VHQRRIHLNAVQENCQEKEGIIRKAAKRYSLKRGGGYQTFPLREKKGQGCELLKYVEKRNGKKKRGLNAFVFGEWHPVVTVDDRQTIAA